MAKALPASEDIVSGSVPHYNLKEASEILRRNIETAMCFVGDVDDHGIPRYGVKAKEKAASLIDVALDKLHKINQQLI